MTDIIQIGEFRLRNKFQKPCNHRVMNLDTYERVIFCEDCGLQLDPFEAMVRLSRVYEAERERLIAEREEIEKLRATHRHLLAARDAETAWRRRNHVPTCPHCKEAIFPEDGFGKSIMSKEVAHARRKATTQVTDECT